MSRVGLPEAVGRWVIGLEWSDVTDHVREATVVGVLQSVAGGIAGFNMPETQIALTMARLEGETGRSTIYVDGMTAPTLTAIFVNSVMFSALEQQEMHVESATHPFEVIVPVALAIAEQQPVSGTDLLTAILAGTEVMIAFAITGFVLAPKSVFDTCQATAVYGAVGAAATAAKLLGLDAKATGWALCHGANLAAGLTEGVWAGTTEYHYALGNASRVGYTAARLAEAGAEPADTIFEGHAGFFRRFAELSVDDLRAHNLPDAILLRLGHVWETPEHIYKRYPVHFNNMPFIDAAKVLRDRYSLTAARISRIRITINRWCELCDGANLGPYTGREATRGPTAFGVAMMLARGHFSLDDAADYSAADVAELTSRTTILTFTDPALRHDWRAVRLEVDSDRGTHVYDGRVDGVPDYRLTRAEVRAIAHDALSRVFEPVRTRAVLDALEALPDAMDVLPMLALLNKETIAAGAAVQRSR
jgi:2-methylcitrate dehydratase PrpD